MGPGELPLPRVITSQGLANLLENLVPNLRGDSALLVLGVPSRFVVVCRSAGTGPRNPWRSSVWTAAQTCFSASQRGCGPLRLSSTPPTGELTSHAQDDVAACFDYYAGKAEDLDARQGSPIDVGHPDFDVKVRREPLGVVAAITPWNYPLLVRGRELQGAHSRNV